jgi:hypothetical protein
MNARLYTQTSSKLKGQHCKYETLVKKYKGFIKIGKKSIVRTNDIVLVTSSSGPS